MDLEVLIHFIGGAIGGTAGTVLTSPFEVVKTRMQSSEQKKTKWRDPTIPSSSVPSTPHLADVTRMNNCAHKRPSNVFYTRTRIIDVVREVYKEGGIRSFYKGLLPNLVGVAPSKAIYFCCYSSCKRLLNERNGTGKILSNFVPDSAAVHMLSAFSAGFATATVINPIWLVKTRLQLHHGPLQTLACVSNIYKNEGFFAFWKGVSASYIGILETIIQFVVYENLRSRIDEPGMMSESSNIPKFMAVGGVSKFVACIATYPHEVLRTRLREEGSSSSILNILRQIWHEKALYRGLSVQLMRSVPNTAITMGTYELIIYVLHNLLYSHRQQTSE